MVPALQDNHITSGPHLSPKVMVFSEDYICLAEEKAYGREQVSSRAPISRAGSKVLDLVDFVAGFLVWVSSVGISFLKSHQGHDTW